MSIATEISRIQEKKGVIRNKLVTLGLATSTDNLDTLATAIDGIDYHSGIAATVLEGSSYTIPKGYHDGSGTVQAQTDVEGDYERYTLQAKTATPTKSAQTLTADQGHYGLSSVTVNPIPDAYQDVSQVDATAGNVLAGKKFVTKDGTLITGTMTNRGAVNKTLDTATASYTVPAGYHSGSGKVSIALEEKTVSPSTSAQSITPTAGKVLSKVTVNAMPQAVRAETTLGSYVDEDGVLVFTAVNDQKAGYQPGGMQTAQKTVELSVAGNTVTASVSGDEESTISASVATVTQATPGISVSAAGVVKATVTQEEGYVAAGTKSYEKQLATQSAKTVTPGTSDQTAVAANKYTTGAITVAGDADLVAGNIKSGVDIFGVAGTFTADATANANQMIAGATAYVKGSKVTGTMPLHGDITGTIDGLTATSYEFAANGAVSSISVSLTDDIENALKEI